jgi:hypothetical protein
MSIADARRWFTVDDYHRKGEAGVDVPSLRLTVATEPSSEGYRSVRIAPPGERLRPILLAGLEFDVDALIGPAA